MPQTKMQQINTAINSGDIKSNLVKGLIEENDTTETLTEKLKQLQLTNNAVSDELLRGYQLILSKH